ncbi:MAG: hypothetical protein R3D58_15195 [Saprospiraceae bacterium]
MQILLSKNNNKTILTCTRADGTFTRENLGPDFPNHDLAHFVVETTFRLQAGFFGNIKSGRTIQELSDKAVIRTLGPESWLAEILSRNLQALAAGACTATEFIELVEWEAQRMPQIQIPEIPLATVEAMQVQFDDLCRSWAQLAENEQLSLIF